MKLTGTFIDVVNNEILSSNWGPREWAREFDSMREIGIDTVILIRSGMKDQMVFESKVLSQHFPMRPAYVDMVDTLLTEAERCGMDFFMGTYDSQIFYTSNPHTPNDPKKEIAINRELAEELMDRYGARAAFKGWYLAQEACAYDTQLLDIYNQLGRHMKSLKDLPILISPLMLNKVGARPEDPEYEELTRLGCLHWHDPEGYEYYWDLAFKGFCEVVDIVAFQDGYVPFLDLPAYLEVNKRLADKYGVTCWSNVESFERNTPLNFLPIDWRNLRYKMEAAEKAGCEKLITFEFSHFMSPNSMWPSARNLYERYKEWR